MFGGAGTELRTVIRYDPATAEETREWRQWHHHTIRGELVVLVETDRNGEERRNWPQESGAPFFHEWPAGTVLRY